MILASLTLVALLQAPAPAAAAANAAPPAPVASADADKPICKRIVPTGSRLGGVKECATAAQWRERERADGDAVRQIQARGFQRQQ